MLVRERLLGWGGGRRGEVCSRTCVLIVEFQKVSFLIQFVGVAIEQCKDGLELRNSVFVNVHDGRLVGLNHGQWSR